MISLGGRHRAGDKTTKVCTRSAIVHVVDVRCTLYTNCTALYCSVGSRLDTSTDNTPPAPSWRLLSRLLAGVSLVPIPVIFRVPQHSEKLVMSQTQYLFRVISATTINDSCRVIQVWFSLIFFNFKFVSMYTHSVFPFLKISFPSEAQFALLWLTKLFNFFHLFVSRQSISTRSVRLTRTWQSLQIESLPNIKKCYKENHLKSCAPSLKLLLAVHCTWHSLAPLICMYVVGLAVGWVMAFTR